MKKKDLLKRRRQLKTDGPDLNISNDFFIPPHLLNEDQPDFLSIPIAPIPDSSGDEYSGSGNTDAVSDISQGDFIGPPADYLEDIFGIILLWYWY